MYSHTLSFVLSNETSCLVIFCATDLPAELMSKYAAAAGNHSKKFAPYKNQLMGFVWIPLVWTPMSMQWAATASFHNSVTNSPAKGSSSWKSSCWPMKCISVAQCRHVWDGFQYPKSELPFEASVLGAVCRWKAQSKRHFASIFASLLFEHQAHKNVDSYYEKDFVLNLCACHSRKNRSKQDDVYHEISLMDLEIQYGSTEAGRLGQWDRS